MFLSGKTPQEIAEERGFVLGTIMGHLSFGVKSGVLKLEQLVAEKDIREIQSVAGKYDSLRPISTILKENMTSGHFGWY